VDRPDSELVVNDGIRFGVVHSLMLARGQEFQIAEVIVPGITISVMHFKASWVFARFPEHIAMLKHVAILARQGMSRFIDTNVAGSERCANLVLVSFFGRSHITGSLPALVVALAESQRFGDISASGNRTLLLRPLSFA